MNNGDRDLGTLLSSLYGSRAAPPQFEKTAEENLLAQLRGDGQEESSDDDENPYQNMTTAELIELAQRVESGEGEEKTASAEGEPDLSELEEAAEGILGGQIMAHALTHEFGLIKEAMAKGLCRVCKSNKADVKGSSVCSACSSS